MPSSRPAALTERFRLNIVKAKADLPVNAPNLFLLFTRNAEKPIIYEVRKAEPQEPEAA